RLGLCLGAATVVADLARPGGELEVADGVVGSGEQAAALGAVLDVAAGHRGAEDVERVRVCRATVGACGRAGLTDRDHAVDLRGDGRCGRLRRVLVRDGGGAAIRR